MKAILLIGFGGALGSILRFALGNLWNTNWPYGTFLVNILGSLVIGFLFALAGQQLLDKKLQWFLMVGFCGGFTTFSSFTLEQLQMLQNNRILEFFMYTIGSFAFGLLAVYLGYSLAKMCF